MAVDGWQYKPGSGLYALPFLKVVYYLNHWLVKLLWCCLFLLLFAACQWQENRVSINDKSTVVYQGGDVTEREAKRLGVVLLDLGYFNAYDQRTVYLRKKGNQYHVTFLMNKEAFLADKENNVAGLRVWQQWLQEQAFGYAPTVLIVADEQKQVLYTLESKNMALPKSTQ